MSKNEPGYNAWRLKSWNPNWHVKQGYDKWLIHYNKDLGWLLFGKTSNCLNSHGWTTIFRKLNNSFSPPRKADGQYNELNDGEKG